MTRWLHSFGLVAALGCAVAHADVPMADIMPPMPPARGTIADDLPAPSLPTRKRWPLAVAGLVLVLLAGGAVGMRRR